MIFYRPDSEHEQLVMDYLRDFERHTNKQLQSIDVDTADGAQLAELYDVMSFPSIVATDDEGKMLQTWSGDMLPRFDEVSYYV